MLSVFSAADSMCMSSAHRQASALHACTLGTLGGSCWGPYYLLPALDAHASHLLEDVMSSPVCKHCVQPLSARPVCKDRCAVMPSGHLLLRVVPLLGWWRAQHAKLAHAQRHAGAALPAVTHMANGWFDLE